MELALGKFVFKVMRIQKDFDKYKVGSSITYLSLEA